MERASLRLRTDCWTFAGLACLAMLTGAAAARAGAATAAGGASTAPDAAMFTQVAKLLAADGVAHEALGSSLAISSDGSTIVAAAPTASVNATTQGALYVFSRPAGGWAAGMQVAKLIAHDGAIGDELGHSPHGVAVSADGSTIVAGAPFATVGKNSVQGALYVFLRAGAAWSSGTDFAKLVASDGARGDALGSVSISSDGATVAAGTSAATVGGNAGQGAVYVFLRTSVGWSSGGETAKLTAGDGKAGDALGLPVAISGDGSTVVAGAAGAAVANHSGQGAVYLFARPGTGWAGGTQTAKLTAGDGAIGDALGTGVAVSDDGSTVAAGAVDAAVNGQPKQGAAYIFTRPAAAWADATQAAKLSADDGAAGDQLGGSMAVSGDGSTAVAGTRFAAVAGNPDQGAAYVYARPASGWANAAESAKLTAGDGATGDEMGLVSVNEDGSLVATGAPFAAGGTADGNPGQGAVYVFSRACSSSATTLCIDDQPNDDRWQVTASYATTEGGGRAGAGEAIRLASLGVSAGGLLWFFDPTNPEMLVKVLDGCATNGQYWVFSSATTNVGFQLTVTDTRTGRARLYTNSDGTAAPPIEDTSAFSCTPPTGRPATVAAAAASPSLAAAVAAAASPSAAFAPAPAAAGSCSNSATLLCLGGRFALQVSYHTAEGGGHAGAGQAVQLTSLGVSQGGLFWFFAAANPEMLVKVLDGCVLNDRYWVFYAAGTNVGFSLTVTDTVTNQSRTYINRDGTAAPPVQDTSALPCG